MGPRLLCAALVLLCAGSLSAEVHRLEGVDLGEGRQVKADLWTHTNGGPRGQAVSLEMVEGNDEAVAQMVAGKKIEIAAAALHHAGVMERQELGRRDRSNAADQAAQTAAKIASVKVKGMQRDIKATNEKISKLKNQQADLSVKQEEASAAVEMASSKGKSKLKAKLKVIVAKNKALKVKLTASDQKAQSLRYRLVGSKEDAEAAVDQAHKARLKNVAERVKLEAAKHKVLHAKYLRLKAKNMKTFAAAKLKKELSQKQNREDRNDVKSAKEMLEIMNSGPGKKEATAALKRAKGKVKKSKKAWADAKKNVNKVKKQMDKNELAWEKKVAYKAVMKTAKLGAEADRADKAFKAALSDSDKANKLAMAKSIKKELSTANKKAERATANLEHIKFAAKAANKARKEADAEAKKAMEAEKKKLSKRNKAAAAAKKALAGTGKPPSR